jgi:ABC-2 type transport system ATP-binding protein
VKGDENSIRDILENIDAISEFNISNGENDSLCLVLKMNSNSDIRENLSMDLAKAGIVILEMKENKQSLEDVFIELTEKEEN